MIGWYIKDCLSARVWVLMYLCSAIFFRRCTVTTRMMTQFENQRKHVMFCVFRTGYNITLLVYYSLHIFMFYLHFSFETIHFKIVMMIIMCIRVMLLRFVFFACLLRSYLGRLFAGSSSFKRLLGYRFVEWYWCWLWYVHNF